MLYAAYNKEIGWKIYTMKSFNECGVMLHPFLEQHRAKLYNKGITSNAMAKLFVKENKECFDKMFIFSVEYCKNNPQTIDILLENWDYLEAHNKLCDLDWYSLSYNKRIYDLIEEKLSYFDIHIHNMDHFWFNIYKYLTNVEWLKKHWQMLLLYKNTFIYILLSNKYALEFIDEKWTSFLIVFSNSYSTKKILYIFTNSNPNMLSLVRKRWDYLLSLIKNNKYVYFTEHYFLRNALVIDIIIEKWDDLIKYNILKICNINHLFQNPNIMDCLIAKWDWFVANNALNWESLSSNKAIFLDKYEYKHRVYFRTHIAAELTSKVFHPSNIHKFIEWGFDPDA